MKSRIIYGWLAMACGVTAFAPQANLVTVADNRGDFSAELGNGHLWDYGTKHPKFESSGEPNLVVKNSEGLQITAHRMSGNYSILENGKSNVDALHAEEKVVIHYNSDTARKYQATNSLPTTEEPGITTELDSESALFNQAPADDKVTLTKPFVLTDNRPSKKKDGQVTLSASKATGSSGVLHFLAPQDGGKGKLQTAEIEGPVHYHVVQTAADPATGKPKISTYDIVGDHLSADLSQPVGKIVLIGHVIWSASNGIDEFHGTCSRLIATTDEEGNITDLEMPNSNTSGSKLEAKP